MSDEQIPKDGHLLSPANKQTTVEKGAINKAVNQLKQNKNIKTTTLKENLSSAPQNPSQWAKYNSLPTHWKVEIYVCISEMAYWYSTMLLNSMACPIQTGKHLSLRDDNVTLLS